MHEALALVYRGRRPWLEHVEIDTTPGVVVERISAAAVDDVVRRADELSHASPLALATLRSRATSFLAYAGSRKERKTWQRQLDDIGAAATTAVADPEGMPRLVVLAQDISGGLVVARLHRYAAANLRFAPVEVQALVEPGAPNHRAALDLVMSFDPQIRSAVAHRIETVERALRPGPTL